MGARSSTHLPLGKRLLDRLHESVERRAFTRPGSMQKHRVPPVVAIDQTLVILMISDKKHDSSDINSRRVRPHPRRAIMGEHSK